LANGPSIGQQFVPLELDYEKVEIHRYLRGFVHALRQNTVNTIVFWL